MCSRNLSDEIVTTCCTQQANHTIRTTNAAADDIEHPVRHRSEARAGARRDAGVEGRPGTLGRLPRDGLCVRV
jgi:hypothetical protein